MKSEEWIRSQRGPFSTSSSDIRRIPTVPHPKRSPITTFQIPIEYRTIQELVHTSSCATTASCALRLATIFFSDDLPAYCRLQDAIV